MINSLHIDRPFFYEVSYHRPKTNKQINKTQKIFLINCFTWIIGGGGGGKLECQATM